MGDESRVLLLHVSRESVIAHKLMLRGPLAILCAAAAWQRVQGCVPTREELFRAWGALDGVSPLVAYPYQRECWQRGWLVVGTCEVTAEGWSEIEGEPQSRRAA